MAAVTGTSYDYINVGEIRPIGAVNGTVVFPGNLQVVGDIIGGGGGGVTGNVRTNNIDTPPGGSGTLVIGTDNARFILLGGTNTSDTEFIAIGAAAPNLEALFLGTDSLSLETIQIGARSGARSILLGTRSGAELVDIASGSAAGPVPPLQGVTIGLFTNGPTVVSGLNILSNNASIPAGYIYPPPGASELSLSAPTVQRGIEASINTPVLTIDATSPAWTDAVVKMFVTIEAALSNATTGDAGAVKRTFLVSKDGPVITSIVASYTERVGTGMLDPLAINIVPNVTPTGVATFTATGPADTTVSTYIRITQA